MSEKIWIFWFEFTWFHFLSYLSFCFATFATTFKHLLQVSPEFLIESNIQKNVHGRVYDQSQVAETN